MISVNNLITEINNLIAAGSLSELEVSQFAKAVDTLEQKGVGRVFSLSEISAENNPGRFVYVESELKYYFSDGAQWITDIKFLTEIDLRSYLYVWGANGYGQLGDNTTTSRSSPVSVVGGFTDWISASAGGSHSIGVRANGTLWSWGSNVQGRLGDNTTVSRSSPVSVVGGFTDWISASAGSQHSLGLRANGTLWAWGSNGVGQLGANIALATSTSSPVSVAGGFTDWISASAGTFFSLGVRANGTLWSWGQGVNGQLGSNNILNRPSPALVVGGFTDWISASAGSQHSLGLRANGTLWAWGSNFYRLGDGIPTADRSSPVSVVGGFTDWVSASAGNNHSLGVRANGTLWAWGQGVNGPLGDNTIINKSSPVLVAGGFTDWISASAGDGHSLGVRANGTLWAWGLNSDGRLGDNTIVTRSSPVSVVGGFANWISASASAGSSHSIGLIA